MKHKILYLTGLVLVAALLLGAAVFLVPRGIQETSLQPEFSEGCTVILVGKDASTDGSVMVTHTADCGICDWTWHFVQASDHAPDAVRKIYHINQIKTWPPETGGKWKMALAEGYTEFDLPQVKHTHAYTHGVFGYMNDHQLAMGESSIGCRRNLRNPTPAVKFDITMLTLLAMERCTTAREAIKLM